MVEGTLEEIVQGDEFLQTWHPPEPTHHPHSSSLQPQGSVYIPRRTGMHHHRKADNLRFWF